MVINLIATGHTEIPCVIRDLTDIQAIETSLSENIGRKNLTDYQEQRSVNLWYDMLLEKKKKNESTISVESKIEFSVKEEIAKKLYGGIITSQISCFFWSFYN